MRTPRSKARATSLWLAKRIFPRLAYRTTRYCTAGLVGAGPVLADVALADTVLADTGTLPPADHGKQPPPVETLSGGPNLDLGAHGRTDPAFITRRPATIFHLARALGRDGILPVLPQPVAVKARIQVIPREHLAVVTFARSIPCKIHRLPGQRLVRASLPALEREVLAPAVEPRAIAPCRQDHGAHPAVAAGQQPLDQAGLPVVVAVPDRLAVAAVRAQRAAERVQPCVHDLRRALSRPLEGRVRLGHEPADRHRAPDIAPPGCLPPGRDDLARQLRDRHHVGVGLGRQAAHEVQLHLAPAAGVGGGDGPDQVLFGDHLVDHLAHPLRTALGSERQPGPAPVTAQLVGQRDVESVHPGGGQRQPDVGPLVAVGQVDGDLVDLAVVGAGQREQPDLAEPAGRHALGDHRADRADGPLAHRPGDHPGLAEPAAAGAAAEDLHAVPLVYGLRDRHDGLARVRPRVQVHHGVLRNCGRYARAIRSYV